MSRICTLCSNNQFYRISTHVRDSNSYGIIQCKKCNHTQLFPIPKHDDEKLFYDNNMQAKNMNYFGSIRDYRKKSLQDTTRRVKIVSDISKKKYRILEIGSGHGFFVEMMKKKNYNIIGIEVSKERRKIAKRVAADATILDINLLEDNPHIGEFHIVVMFHVLEHILNPILFLRKIRDRLKPNGKLIVEVPNFNDYQIKLNRAYEEWHFQRAHIHYFTPKTLKYVLTKSGFKKITIHGIQRYGIENMISWKINKTPQMNNPSYELDDGYKWIDNMYKTYLERQLICDTIMAIAS